MAKYLIHRHLFAGVAVAACIIAADQARADRYRFDERHTHIQFTWDHLGVSYQSGRFSRCEGELSFDPANPAAAELSVALDAAGLDTGVPDLDRFLRSPRFFHVRAFPKVTFTSTRIDIDSDRTGRVTGVLTMKGIAKPVTLDVRWNYTGWHPWGRYNPRYWDWFISGFSATTKLKRSDWDLGAYLPLVPDEIAVSIETELVRIHPKGQKRPQSDNDD